MGWKGSLRAVNSVLNSMERDQKAREREIERGNVANIVSEFDQFVNRVTTIHLNEPPEVNWDELLKRKSPIKPLKDTSRSDQLKSKYENYKPNVFNNILNNSNKSLDKLQSKIINMESLEDSEYQKSLIPFNEKYQSWKAENELLEKMFNGDEKSIEEAFIKYSDIRNVPLGKSFTVSADSTNLFIMEINVNDIDIIPKEIRTQLKSGKLSMKQMPKTKYFGLYQDHICSSILCGARYIFDLLPYDKIIVNAMGERVSTISGKKEIIPIISVFIPRETFDSINLSGVDPSDSMENFICNMKFVKTKGFSGVEKINPEKFLTV